MPRPMGAGKGLPDKSKNFGQAMKRLFKELTSFKIVISIAIILAVAGSILSIIAPNRLSKLTDKITEGLFVNQTNMQSISENILSNMQNINVQKIMLSSSLNEYEKQEFMQIMSSINPNDEKLMLQSLSNLS